MKERIIALEQTIAACDVSMTERLLHENERLKDEIKSLKETKNGDKYQKVNKETEPNIIDLVNMKQSGHERAGPQNESIAKSKSIPKEPQCGSFKCGLCKLVCENSAKLGKHMKNHDEDGDWTCDGCSYQTNNQNDLLNHLLEKRNHSATLLDYLLTKNVYERKEKCTICGDLFKYKDNLHTHLNKDHKTYKPCNRKDTCSGDPYRFNHDVIGEGVSLCYQCGKQFASRKNLMEHMKDNHIMPECKHHKAGNCTFQGRCWYSHRITNTSVQKTHEKVALKQAQVPDCWSKARNKEPPSLETTNQQQLLDRVVKMNQEMMASMMTQMNQNMMNMMIQMNQHKQ